MHKFRQAQRGYIPSGPGEEPETFVAHVIGREATLCNGELEILISELGTTQNFIQAIFDNLTTDQQDKVAEDFGYERMEDDTY